MNIIHTFLQLTARTYPHGTEVDIFETMDELSPVPLLRVGGNLIGIIGEASEVLFTSHLDTYRALDEDPEVLEVKHVHEGRLVDIDNLGPTAMINFDLLPTGGLLKTDGKTILGADDKAGVTVMLFMMHQQIPGVYAFFVGEEVGLAGSRRLAARHESFGQFDKVVSFDRRGTASVITHQKDPALDAGPTPVRCCSDEFARALCDQLNRAFPSFGYAPDPTGVSTDSRAFMHVFPECTNVSVGYLHEHRPNESQDLDHLVKLAHACCLVDWEGLPVVRKPGNG